MGTKNEPVERDIRLRGTRAVLNKEFYAGLASSPLDAQLTVIKALLPRLTLCERTVMEFRLGLREKYLSLQQIGDLHRVTRERIRQTEARAIRRLRRLLLNETGTLAELGIQLKS